MARARSFSVSPRRIWRMRTKYFIALAAVIAATTYATSAHAGVSFQVSVGWPAPVRVEPVYAPVCPPPVIVTPPPRVVYRPPALRGGLYAGPGSSRPCLALRTAPRSTSSRPRAEGSWPSLNARNREPGLSAGFRCRDSGFRLSTLDVGVGACAARTGDRLRSGRRGWNAACGCLKTLPRLKRRAGRAV